MVSYKDLGLVNTREMFAKAIKGGYAIPAFNFNNMEQMQAIIQACVEASSPVILQVSSGARKYANQTLLRYMAQGAVEYAKELGKNIPIVLHLDHGNSFELCKSCIDMGFSSVMIDGSHLPYEENVALTKQVVDYAHQFDVTVEGELGVLAGVEDEVSAEHHTYTDPKDVVDFVSKTGVDSLAISIGTSHGANKFKPELPHRAARIVVGSAGVREDHQHARRCAEGCRRHSRRAAPQGRQERCLQDQHRLGRPSGDDRSHPQDLRRPARRVRPPQISGSGPRRAEETLHAQVRERAGFGRQGLIRNIPTKKPGLERPGFFRFRRALPENGGSGEKSRKGAEFRTQSDAETSDIPRSGRDRTESSN